MDESGNIYIEGANVGYDHHTTDFFDYLGAGFVNIGQENVIDIIKGVEGTFSAPNEFAFPDGDADYNIDELSAGDGTVFLTCQDDQGRAVYYDGGSYRAICSSPVLGSFSDGEGSSSKVSMMARYLAYLSGSEEPDIWVSHNAIDFDIQYIDHETSIPLNVQNLGFSELNINSTDITGEGFSMESEPPYTLPTGGELDFSVSFMASEAGIYAGSITIASNDPDENPLVINLEAECLLPPIIGFSADELYEEVSYGETAERILTIDNSGDSDLSFLISLINPDEPVISKNTHRSSDFNNIVLAKGEYDYRQSEPVLCGSGGPDGYGYRWIDSDEPNGPDYEWFDISGIGYNSGLSGDDAMVQIQLPFVFSFYGNSKTSVNICTNGYLTFVSGNSVWNNNPIPNTDIPNDMIAPFWDDLHQQSGSNYYYYDEENNRFIIQYSNWGFFSGGGSLTFQVQLYENGGIFFYYDSMVGTLNSATIGIENSDGSDGLQIAFNTSYIENGLAVCISSGPLWLSVDNDSGIIPAGLSEDITFTFDARGVTEGFYEANAIITSNDPVQPEKIIPVTMLVGPVNIDEISLPYVTRLNGNYPNPFNAVTSISFDLAVKSHITIEIFNVLGQKVTTLTDDILNAGSHTVKWNADVSSGVYFYKMKTGDYIKTKRMLLLK